MGTSKDLALVDVVVVFGGAGALLLEPRLYMLRIAGFPGVMDAIEAVDGVEAPPAPVIQGKTTPDPGHGVAFIVSIGGYVNAAATCCCCCCWC